MFVNTNQKEYLLVKSFHIVFEAIIDTLIGDNPLPDGMDKKQEDGKIVDHLYTAKSLVEGDTGNTYYIGDSKYYKMGNELGKESVYKQYTYARNVIQWNLDIFNDGRIPSSGVKLRDDETEGYNIIPNFFISATMDGKFDYGNDGIKETDRKSNRYMSKQFDNRLYDRDTLLLFHYDVNFLYCYRPPLFWCRAPRLFVAIYKSLSGFPCGTRIPRSYTFPLFRGLSRLSSALSAKASTLRSLLLDLS